MIHKVDQRRKPIHLMLAVDEQYFVRLLLIKVLEARRLVRSRGCLGRGCCAPAVSSGMPGGLGASAQKCRW